MPAAPFPANEIDRVSALRTSGLLESGPDADLDVIVRQAAALWGTPIAAVSLLDGTHQHFKASVGVGVPVYGQDRQPFGALCVIDTIERLAVDDASIQSLLALSDQVSKILSAPHRSWP